MNLVIKQTRVVEVPVNTITLAATCQQAMLIDATGQCVGSTNAMPAFMPTLLEIDLATGRIKNWTVPSCEQLQDIADTSEIQRMSEGEYHHFMNDRLFRNAVPLEQATTPPQTDDGWVDESHMPYGYFDDERDPALLNSAPTLGSTSAPTQALESDAVTVASTADCAPPDQQSNSLEIEGFDEPTEADTALCPAVPVTCPMLSKGQVDLAAVEPEPALVEPVTDPDDIKPICTLKKTLEALPIENGDLPADYNTKLDVTVNTRDNGEYVATTGAGKTYVRASSRDSAWAALKNLIKKCGIVVSDTAIVETTNAHDSAQRRFSIDTSFAEPSDSDLANDEIAYSGDTELPEPTATNPAQIDIEEAIAEALARPEPVIDNDAPAPVDVVTELSLSPAHVMNQLIAVQQRQSDPVYSAFFAARGITEGGKLSSKGARLLANLSQAETTERAEQIIKNACELPEPPATYAEIVALINHAATQMQCLALMDRIAKHENTEERRELFALQKNRVDAFKADSAA